MSTEPVDRRAYSRERLAALGEELRPLEPLLAGRPLCIYATGSYGRLEAWQESDIDLFFLYEPEHEEDEFPWITFVRLTAPLIDVTETMGFPPFSGDGKYLARGRLPAGVPHQRHPSVLAHAHAQLRA
jgi:signal-transduction protein with cAMP-binding, CBS, and nucleotidyltransferase domain